MRVKYLISAGILVCAATAPAFADSYYVVQDSTTKNSTTKKCTVVAQKPTTTTTTVVGDGKVYTSQTEAENAMKTVTICQSK
jgi:patatin-like phospholipase/acyl hydrolase